MAPVYVTLSQYRAVRAISEYFLVIPEHVEADVERVVHTTERLAVVKRLPAEPEDDLAAQA
jgi:hypothetical protein